MKFWLKTIRAKMIYWVPFLHIYQPPTQSYFVLKKICNECYRPLFKMFLKHPQAKVTININAVLSQMLVEQGFVDVITSIKMLAERKQLEFVGSAMYHPILPLVAPREAVRQIRLNHQTNLQIFGPVYRPKGFFPPEMAFGSSLIKLLARLKYEWVILSGIAAPLTEKWPQDFISENHYEKCKLKVFFRDDIVSNKISFRQLDSFSFIRELAVITREKTNSYVITAMDGETFGHHIPHAEQQFLAKTFETMQDLNRITGRRNLRELKKQLDKIGSKSGKRHAFKTFTISELFSHFSVKKTKVARDSSWSTTNEDLSANNFYPLWKDPGNEIHSLLWQHLELCRQTVLQAASLRSGRQSREFAALAREGLDKSLHSCQWWWANKARNIFSISMINKGLSLQEETLLFALRALICSKDEQIKDLARQRLQQAGQISARIRLLILQE